jgi:hypothetical protein
MKEISEITENQEKIKSVLDKGFSVNCLTDKQTRGTSMTSCHVFGIAASHEGDGR